MKHLIDDEIRELKLIDMLTGKATIVEVEKDDGRDYDLDTLHKGGEIVRKDEFGEVIGECW